MIKNNPTPKLRREIKKAIELYKQVGNLSERDIFILQNRYGDKILSLGEISKLLGISRQRISQIEHKLIRKIGGVDN